MDIGLGVGLVVGYVIGSDEGSKIDKWATDDMPVYFDMGLIINATIILVI